MYDVELITFSCLQFTIFFFFSFSSEERKWRKWADEVFVHTLSPNVYRTIDESYRTFNWFSEVSESIITEEKYIDIQCDDK